jgi:hypothetical protein
VAQIQTIKGLLDESTLTRTVMFEERPQEFVISVEWRLPRTVPLPDLRAGASVDEQLVRAREMQGELVKRDCHVILKTPSAVATAVAASLG